MLDYFIYFDYLILLTTVQNSIADAGGANSSGSRTRNNAAFRLQGLCSIAEWVS